MDLSYQRSGWREDRFDRGADNAATAGRVDPFLFLPAVTEPYSDHLFLHIELVRDHGDLLRGRFLVLLENGKCTRNALTATHSLKILTCSQGCDKFIGFTWVVRHNSLGLGG